MTKAQAEKDFNQYILPEVKMIFEQDGITDFSARQFEWSAYTDRLCKDGVITTTQYNNWTTPKNCKRN
jgi:hypothetical protein